MPLQNRVTPFGQIVATPERGLFTGNRGIIHDPATKTLLGRRWTTKAWITCTCDYKGIRRDVMARRSWTELFFLDEATALAAGHRPCFLCRRAAANAFRAAWAQGNGGHPPSAPQIDGILHQERLHARTSQLHPLPSGRLPNGAMVTSAGTAFLIVADTSLRWSAAGYVPAAPPVLDGLITPPSTLAALNAGYQPVLHPSVGAQV